MVAEETSGGTGSDRPLVSSGDSVFTSDGNRLGRVCDVKGGYFAVELPGGDSFWLSSRYAEMAADGEVRLNVSGNEAQEHRLSAPGLEDREAGNADAVIGNDEALDQRERMERELAAQRERLERERAAAG
jgi:hypothetical protein